jgi:hypothetical protein
VCPVRYLPCGRAARVHGMIHALIYSGGLITAYDGYGKILWTRSV